MQSIKKYTIHILAITAFNPKYFEIPFDLPDERNAGRSSSSSDMSHIFPIPFCKIQVKRKQKGGEADVFQRFC